MNENICQQVTDAIIHETINTIPQALLSFYRDLPGRMPSERSKRISKTLEYIEDTAAEELIRDAVDMTIHGILYLMDNRFKDKGIQVLFIREGHDSIPKDCPLLELYREKVEAGGEVFPS